MMKRSTTLYFAIAVLVVVTLIAVLFSIREQFKVLYMTPTSSGNRSITVSTSGDGPSREIAEGRHISSLSVDKDWAVHAYPDPKCSSSNYKTYNEGNHTSVTNPVRCLFADNLKVGKNITAK